VNSINRSIDYEKVKNIYDLVREGDPEMVHQLFSYVSLESDSLVLDVGCGTANNTLLFREIVKTRVVGIDITLGMLQRAIIKSGEILYIQSPAENLPFKPDTFDFVFMTEVVHHLNNIKSAVLEILRVLKHNCPLCIVTQSHEQIEHRTTSRFFPATVFIDKDRYPRITELEQLLLIIGFSTVNSQSYEFTPVGLGTEFLQTIEMRGFSMLHKISDEDYEKGLKALKSVLSRGEDLPHVPEYTFVWARK
jgi:ubiquinone/menaquinone biosynthesis C-methylase UbiE